MLLKVSPLGGGCEDFSLLNVDIHLSNPQKRQHYSFIPQPCILYDDPSGAIIEVYRAKTVRRQPGFSHSAWGAEARLET